MTFTANDYVNDCPKKHFIQQLALLFCCGHIPYNMLTAVICIMMRLRNHNYNMYRFLYILTLIYIHIAMYGIVLSSDGTIFLIYAIIQSEVCNFIKKSMYMLTLLAIGFQI